MAQLLLKHSIEGLCSDEFDVRFSSQFTFAHMALAPVAVAPHMVSLARRNSRHRMLMRMGEDTTTEARPWDPGLSAPRTGLGTRRGCAIDWWLRGRKVNGEAERTAHMWLETSPEPSHAPQPHCHTSPYNSTIEALRCRPLRPGQRMCGFCRGCQERGNSESTVLPRCSHCWCLVHACSLSLDRASRPLNAVDALRNLESNSRQYSPGQSRLH